ncbi:MAG: hypothetical protein AAB597_01730, partial [Patescibacteria group bacterium]
ILGKLDVSTIDPVYTIAGIKYATYGHSTIGVKEEVLQTLVLSKLDTKNGRYYTDIVFDELNKGEDVWLFYQVTDFGEEWRNLTVALTAAFDGNVFYKKMPEENTLRVYGSEKGEVSMRLAANRFDSQKWSNLRLDQEDGFTHFTLPDKSIR